MSSISLINADGNLKLTSELNTPTFRSITNATDAGNTAQMDQAGNVFITDSDITGAGPYTYKFNTPSVKPSVRTAHFMCPKASAASMCGLGINGNVVTFQNAIYLDASSEALYVGTSQNGGGGSNLAKYACWYDISNNVINPFDKSYIGGFSNTTNAFAADASFVYLGGSWGTNINGVPNTKCSAKILKTSINTSTPLWYPIDASGTSSNNQGIATTINALYLDSTSKLYTATSAGRLFKTTGVNSINTPLANTSQVANVYNREVDIGPVINTLVPNNSNNLLIGGNFTFANLGTIASRSDSLRVNNIAVYDMSNNTIRSLGKTSESDIDVGLDGQVFAIYVDPSAAVPTIYVGGTFTSADRNVRSRNIVKITNYLTSDISYTALDIGVDGVVYAITRVGQQLYVGGNFLSVGSANIHSRFLAIWDLTLNRWISTGHAFTGTIPSIVHNPAKNVLYIGGAFGIGGGVYNQLVQLDLSGGLTLQNSSGNAFYKMIGTAGMVKPNIGAAQQCKFITDASGNIDVCNLIS